MKCSICKKNELVKGFELYDDRYGYHGNFVLLNCLHCGHTQLNAEFSPEQLSKLYTNYYPRSSFDVQQYQPWTESNGLDAWLDGDRCAAVHWVPKNVRILDIGCGFGESLGYHLARGCEVFGVEADENIEKIAHKFNFNVHIGLFESGLYECNYFDYVTLDQVIEHVSQPVQMLNDIAQILKPGGKVIISTPNAKGWGSKVFRNRWINWHAPYHLHHFSVQSMRLAAEKAGLNLVSTRTITHSDWLYYQLIHLTLLPKMGNPSPFWSPDLILSLREKLFLKIFTAIHSTKINHLFTRLFDSLGIGDNHLFILVKS